MTRQTSSASYSPSSPDDYRRKYPHANVILNLDPELLVLSASKWGLEHLIVCRLIIQKSHCKILPILQKLAPNSKDLQDHEEKSNIQRLINGIDKEDLRCKAYPLIKKENGNLGALWSSLAQCLASSNISVTNKHSQRDTRSIMTKEQPSIEYDPMSSSPSGGAESSTSSRLLQQSYQDSLSDDEVNEDKHDDRNKGEVVTVKLAEEFIGFGLDCCAGQDPASKTLCVFQAQPHRVHYELSFLRIDATDDGGIWVVRSHQPGKTVWRYMRRLVLLEAKRAFGDIDDGHQPTVSDAHLAQYTCEALSAFLEDQTQNEYVYPCFI